MGAEVVRRVQTSGVKKIAPAAHLVHFGLLLLLIGHVFTTVLVDRGDASHRITLVRGEFIEVGDYEYMFEHIVLEDEDLEVGDRYVGAVISVYQDGEKIGTVQPGLIGFDTGLGHGLEEGGVKSQDKSAHWLTNTQHPVGYILDAF